MAKISVISAIFCILVINNCLVNASILSWFTGSGANRENVSTNVPVPGGGGVIGAGGIVPSIYPEESGECSHWGDAIPQHLPIRDPMTQVLEFNKGLALSNELIGSHKHLPVGSIVAVTNMKNGNTVSVRVVSPKSIPIFGRLMDLSPTAFAQVANLREGIFVCSVRVIQAPRTTPTHSLSSYTLDNMVKAKPTAFVEENPSLRTQVGTSSITGLGVLGGRTTQYAAPYMAGGGISPLPPVYIGGSSGYKGISSVTAYNPDEEFK